MAERNTTPEDKPRIDLNGCRRPPSTALVGPSCRLGKVRDRLPQNGPYKGQAESGGDAGFQLDLSQPGRFRLRSPLDLVGVRVRVPRPGNEEKPIILASPWATIRDRSARACRACSTSVRVIRSPTILGRVNVDWALKVLRADAGD